MLSSIAYLLPSQPLNRYRFQMLQAKLNKTSIFPITDYSYQPLYEKQQLWTDTTARAVSKLLDYTDSLAQAAKLFDAASPTSVLNCRTALSSNPQAITALAQGKADRTSYTVEVMQIASAQVNKSSLLDTQAPTVVQSGLNRFTVKINGRDYELAINTASTDTARQSLAKIAEAVNQRGLGIRAQLTNDRMTGKSHLTLTSSKTGALQAFSINDLQGNAIRATGLDNTAAQAADAVYAIDGKRYTSATNTVKLGDSLDVAFHKATAKAETIRVDVDHESIVKQLKNVLYRYNRLRSFLDENRFAFAPDVLLEWAQIDATNRSRLSDIGISRRIDGTLALRVDKLSQALDHNDPFIAHTLSSPGGLLANISSQAAKVLYTPFELLAASASPALFRSPYHAYMLPNLFLNQAATTGLFFNRLY